MRREGPTVADQATLQMPPTGRDPGSALLSSAACTSRRASPVPACRTPGRGTAWPVLRASGSAPGSSPPGRSQGSGSTASERLPRDGRRLGAQPLPSCLRATGPPLGPRRRRSGRPRCCRRCDHRRTGTTIIRPFDPTTEDLTGTPAPKGGAGAVSQSREPLQHSQHCQSPRPRPHLKLKNKKPEEEGAPRCRRSRRSADPATPRRTVLLLGQGPWQRLAGSSLGREGLNSSVRVEAWAKDWVAEK